MAKKNKNVGKAFIVFVVISLVWSAIGLLGLLFAPNTPEQFQSSINYSVGLWVLISVIFYVICELFMLYYKSGLLIDYIYTFSKFLQENVVIAVISFIFGALSFTAVYLLKNALKWISGVPSALTKAFSASSRFLADNTWLVGLAAIIGAVILLKWLLYKFYIEEK